MKCFYRKCYMTILMISILSSNLKLCQNKDTRKLKAYEAIITAYPPPTTTHPLDTKATAPWSSGAL